MFISLPKWHTRGNNMENSLNKIISLVRDVRDYPKEGIIFKDITPVLQDHEAFSTVIDRMKINIISNPAVIPKKLVSILSRIEEETAHYNENVTNILLGYRRDYTYDEPQYCHYRN